MANTAGDQPEDVEDQIRNMCFEFITNPNAVILAVTAANQDLVNSDGLKMARTVDPDGDRTIGVLTKVDIMDSGTDCTDILNNKVIPLKKGYIAVVNRSQKDIQDGLPIRSGLKKENEYLYHTGNRRKVSWCSKVPYQTGRVAAAYRLCYRIGMDKRWRRDTQCRRNNYARLRASDLNRTAW